MKKRTKTIVLLILLIAVGLVAISVFPKGYKLYEEERTARDLLEKCKNIKMGMTYDEVVVVMGESPRVLPIEHRGRMAERLVFSSPRLAAEPTSCIIDKASGIVVEIICGEGHWITEPEQKYEELNSGDIIQIF